VSARGRRADCARGTRQDHEPDTIRATDRPCGIRGGMPSHHLDARRRSRRFATHAESDNPDALAEQIGHPPRRPRGWRAAWAQHDLLPRSHGASSSAGGASGLAGAGRRRRARARAAT
jgi:hypothetical protein